MNGGMATVFDGTSCLLLEGAALARALPTALLWSARFDQRLLAGPWSAGYTTVVIPCGPKGAERIVVSVRGRQNSLGPVGGSPGSGARYWIVHPFPEQRRLLVVQELPKGARTSVHWHREETETFWCLAGACRALKGTVAADDPTHAVQEQTTELRAGDPTALSLVVPPLAVHQLVSDAFAAVNLLLISDTDARTHRELNHHYVQWR